MRIGLHIGKFHWPGSPENISDKLTEIAQVADDAYKFENWVLETVDGRAYLVLIKGIDNKLGVKVQYAHKEEVRDMLDEVMNLIVEGTLESINLAVDKFTTTLDT